MKRRTFLETAAGSLVSVGFGRAQSTTDFVVVGAGPFGGWTALSLREMGHQVTLVDAYGPGNSRASSGGETRQIRVGYGEREIYSRWVLKAFEKWRAREGEWSQKLMFRTGRLQLSSDWTESLRATREVFEKLGVEYEVIDHGELARRYPQMSPKGVELALFEPGAAVLRARFSMGLVAEDFQKKGGRFLVGRARPPGGSGPRLESLALESGERLSASTYLFACGPWLPKMFPSLMKKKLSVPRRDVFFFGTPAGDDRFTYPNFPNYSEESHYGFPSIDERGFKVCPVGERTEFDPDTDERVASPHYLKRARDYLSLRFPALADQPLLESRVCQLEMSVDEHFIVQHHPNFSNVWIAGGGSGHAFKHGPVLGEYIAHRLAGEDREPELASVFRLKEENL